MSYKCHLCNLETKQLNGLMCRHYKSHCSDFYTKEQYKIDILNNNGRPQGKCLICGKPTKIGKGESEYPKYCHPCYYISLKGETNPNFKGALKKYKCAFCGKEVERFDSIIKSNKNVFCSTFCSMKFYSVPENYTEKYKKNHIILPNGKSLAFVCKERGISIGPAKQIYKEYGIDELLNYVNNHSIKPIIVLSSGVTLHHYCKSNSIPHCNALKIYKKFGLASLEMYLKNYSPPEFRVLPNGKFANSYCINNKANKKIVMDLFDNESPQAAQDYIDGYIRKKTNIEYMVERETGIDFYNKQILTKNNERYRPDFKLTETIYLDIDGLYWHSEENKKHNYHFEKRENYEGAGFRLIQIREDELNEKLDIVLSMINITMGKDVTKIHARKTEIKEISNKEAFSFFETNHLMGPLKSSKAIGLYLNNNLVMCASYKKYKDGIDISRLATIHNTIVVGGVGKLINYIIRQQHPSFVQSFVDLRYATGKSLELLGFKREGVALGWKWTDNKKTYNRLSCKANMDERRLSEKEYAQELGLYKVYDSGQAKYIKHL